LLPEPKLGLDLQSAHLAHSRFCASSCEVQPLPQTDAQGSLLLPLPYPLMLPMLPPAAGRLPLGLLPLGLPPLVGAAVVVVAAGAPVLLLLPYTVVAMVAEFRRLLAPPELPTARSQRIVDRVFNRLPQHLTPISSRPALRPVMRPVGSANLGLALARHAAQAVQALLATSAAVSHWPAGHWDEHAEESWHTSPHRVRLLFCRK
jgi:hypothetical protein